MARSTESRFATSFIAGLLMIPVSAVAAFALVSSATTTEQPTTTLAVPVPVVTTQAPVEVAAETVVIGPVEASAADYAAACGADGLALVEMETAELLDEVQQAVLDALRAACAEIGTPLPDPAAPPPQVITVTVADSVTAAVDSVVQATFSGGEEHEYEEHDEHDEHDEDDEHEEREDD